MFKNLPEPLTRKHEYIYEIRGSEEALEKLQYDLSQDYGIHLWEEVGPEDEMMHGLRWFQTDLCNEVADDYLAAQVGEELIWLLNGALSISNPELRFDRVPDITPESIFGSSESKAYKPIKTLRKEPPLKLVKVTNAQTPIPHRDVEPEYLLYRTLMEKKGRTRIESSYSEMMRLVNLSLEKEPDYVLIKLCGMEFNWVTIGMLRDTLVAAAGENAIDKEIDDKFGNTANNFSITKFGSRHGLKKKYTGNPDKVISLMQAVQWMLDAVRKYILPKLQPKQ